MAVKRILVAEKDEALFIYNRSEKLPTRVGLVRDYRSPPAIGINVEIRSTNAFVLFDLFGKIIDVYPYTQSRPEYGDVVFKKYFTRHLHKYYVIIDIIDAKYRYYAEGEQIDVYSLKMSKELYQLVKKNGIKLTILLALQHLDDVSPSDDTDGKSNITLTVKIPVVLKYRLMMAAHNRRVPASVLLRAAILYVLRKEGYQKDFYFHI